MLGKYKNITDPLDTVIAELEEKKVEQEQYYKNLRVEIDKAEEVKKLRGAIAEAQKKIKNLEECLKKHYCLKLKNP